MIFKVEGDILLTKAKAIVHGAGVNDPMEKGLALKLCNNNPGLQKDFDRWCYQHNAKPGDAWMWSSINNSRIVTLITHENTERNDHHYEKATLHNIRQALDQLVKIIAFDKLASIALPKLGTGFGDLDWDDVFPLIENSLGGLAIPVYVYVTYYPGQPANEAAN